MATPPLNLEAALAATRSVLLPEILDVADLALWMRCSESTARAHLRAGRIPGRRLGRRWLTTRQSLLRALDPHEKRSPEEGCTYTEREASDDAERG